MIRTLLYTDAIPLLSGLARCARELSARFHNHPDYDIFQAGWHSMGMPHSYPLQIFPVVRGQGDEPERLFQIIRQVGIHYVIAIGDTFYFEHLGPLRERLAKEVPHLQTRWVGWITVDGDPIMPRQLKAILSFDRIVPMSRFAEREIQKAAEKALVEDSGFSPLEKYRTNLLIPTMKTVYPGVDMGVFYPRGVALTLGGRRIDRESTFMGLVVDQNTSRKAVPTAIEAFAAFSKGKTDTFLYLATDAGDPNGTNLHEIIEHLGLKDRTYVRGNSPIAGMPEEEIANLYNVATVLLSCTTGEGFKLPILEAMASCCLNVMPDYTSPTELLEGGRGILVPAAGHWTGQNNFHKRIVHVSDMVEGLEKAYALWKNDRESLKRIHDAGVRFAASQTWEKTFQGIEAAMRGICTDQPVAIQAV